jgi:type VI secretion system protein
MLILHLVPNDPAHGESPARRIEVAKRLTIGRGADNDLVLLDPNRYLSKTHCIIDVDGDSCTITDTSTNGVFLGSSADRLPRDTPTPLVEGSVLRLGGYQMTVAVVSPSASEPVRPPAESYPAPTSPAVAAPIDDGLFGDPLAASAAAHVSSAAMRPEGADDLRDLGMPQAGVPSGHLIPDDFDPVAGTDGHLPWAGGSQPDHARADNAYFAPPKATMENLPDDWDALASSPGSRPAPRSLPPDAGLDKPLRREPALHSAAASPATAPDDGDGAALATFLVAVGFARMKLSETEKLRVMRVAGETLQALVKGITEVLAARASTKQEFRIERTTVGAMRNNPLKFAGGPDEALRALLLARAPGFLSAKEAVDEALSDIKSHQLAVLAGMQVALTTVIGRFDPANLEDRLEQGSLIEEILPAARKARYWDLFKALYKEIATELEDDFQKAFGAEFARAYKEQLDRL